MKAWNFSHLLWLNHLYFSGAQICSFLDDLNFQLVFAQTWDGVGSYELHLCFFFNCKARQKCIWMYVTCNINWAASKNLHKFFSICPIVKTTYKSRLIQKTSWRNLKSIRAADIIGACWNQSELYKTLKCNFFWKTLQNFHAR